MQKYRYGKIRTGFGFFLEQTAVNLYIGKLFHSYLLVTFILSSASAFSFNQSKILLPDKVLKECIPCFRKNTLKDN